MVRERQIHQANEVIAIKALTRVQPEYRQLTTLQGFDEFVNGSGLLTDRGQLAEQYDYDWHARKLTFEPHFRALILLHATHYESGRDIQWAAQNDVLFEALGAGFAISVPGFSAANAERPLEPYLQLLDRVMTAVGRLPHRRLRAIDKDTWQGIVDQLNQVDIFDATRMQLPPTLAEWVDTTPDEASFKLQLKVDGLSGQFKHMMVTSPDGNDNAYFDTLLDLETSDQCIYLFDAGYFNIDTYHEIAASNNYFVTKLHANIKPELIHTRPVPEQPVANGYQVLDDRYVTLTGDDRWYRCLHVRLSTGKEITILTNLLWLPVAHICLLYRYRWSVEILFRWLQDLLQFDHWISHDPRGVVRQVVTALIVWGLLIIMNQDDRSFSPKQLWRELQAAMHQAIFEYGRSVGRDDAHVALSAPE